MTLPNKAAILRQKQGSVETKKELNNRLSALFIKYKEGRTKRKALVPFKQPCLILLKNDLNAEVYESDKGNGLKNNEFIFMHSDGNERTIDCKGSPLYKFSYGDENFLAYILPEDSARPLGATNPTPDFTIWKNSIHNAFSAENKWKAEDTRAKSQYLKWIAVILAVAVAGLTIWLTLKPNDVQPAATITDQLLRNATIIIQK